MTQPQNRTAEALRKLSKVFEQSAGLIDPSAAKQLRAAADEIDALQRYNEAMADKLRTVESFKAGTTSEDADTVFLIDGSGSMTATAFGTKKTIIDAAIESILRSGGSTAVALWGEEKRPPVELTTLSSFMQAGRGLACGTAFAPVVEYMDKLASVKPRRFVVISDGDMLDANTVPKVLARLLLDHQKTKVDFIMVGTNRTSQMEKVISAVNGILPDQVTYAFISSQEELDSAVKGQQPAKSAGPYYKTLRP